MTSCCGPYADCGADCECPPDCGCKQPGGNSQSLNCARCTHHNSKSTVKVALKTLGISTVVAAAAVGTFRLMQNVRGKVMRSFGGPLVTFCIACRNRQPYKDRKRVAWPSALVAYFSVYYRLDLSDWVTRWQV